MSYEAQKWAWEISPTLNSSTEVVVLVLLADMANDENDCWPSVSFIEEKTRVTRKTVFKVLESLANMGLIIRKPQPGLITHYLLNVGATRSNFATSSKKGTSSKKTPTPVVILPRGSGNFTTTPVVNLPPEPIKNLNITSNNEPEIYTPPKTKRQKQVFEKPNDVSQELFDRIVQHRKDIKKPFKSQDGVNGILKQMRLAKEQSGNSLEEIVDFWAEQEWQGFRSDWYMDILNKQKRFARNNQTTGGYHSVTYVPEIPEDVITDWTDLDEFKN